jgi:hypothetical protein
MTNTTRIPSRRRRLAPTIGAVAAVAALAAPSLASASQQLDPAIYETGVPAGVVEHGVVALDITGTPKPQHSKTEYWATSTSWRSITRDASGAITSRALSTPSGSAFLSTTGDKYSYRASIPSPPPFAGWSAAYNKKLVERGTLQASGAETVAGIEGTRYVVPDSKKSTDPNAAAGSWVTDDTTSETTLVLENGTFAPLVRETTHPNNGQYGTFDQRESLVSRDREPLTAANASAARVTKGALSRLGASWKAKATKKRSTHRG